ncbi:MAG: hypothetical protein OQJ76_03525 [Rhodospirillales bacterium]|nr:hypothetical protein [Rhodospirillales bacterium]
MIGMERHENNRPDRRIIDLADTADHTITLYDHFADCVRLGRYLTIPGTDIYVTSDQIRDRRPGTPLARLSADSAAVAAIFSRDPIVAETALLPLARSALHSTGLDHEKMERLFALIIDNAQQSRVRESAREVALRRFRESEIRTLENDLGNYIAPARRRLQSFLGVLDDIAQGRMTPGEFHQEFVDFTRNVAGRIDFGVFAICLDGIMIHPKIPLEAKVGVVDELMRFPKLLQRELLTNALVKGRANAELLRYIRKTVLSSLTAEAVVEIRLLEAYKRRKLTSDQIRRALDGEMDIAVVQALSEDDDIAIRV